MSSIEPDDGSRKIDRAQKVDRSLIISGGNRSILLQLGKKVLNQMSGFVQLFVIVPLMLAVAFWRNDCRFSLRFASTVSATKSGNNLSAPSKSQACPGVR